MREVSVYLSIVVYASGITPACAGSIKIHDIFLFATRDHPRVCGKYLHELMEQIERLGSPPRVREVFK